MFSPELKHEISEKIQEILQKTEHPELPEGEISFILHVDGGPYDAWANIRNNDPHPGIVPLGLDRNMTYKEG